LIADTAMHTLLFCPSWTAERTLLFEWLELNVLDKIYGSIGGAAMCFAACWIRGFLRGHHMQEGAGRVGASSPERALLARACLSSDDNHV